MAETGGRIVATPGRALVCVAILGVFLAAVTATTAQAPGGPPRPADLDRDARREILSRVLDQPEFQRGAAALLLDHLRQRVSRWFLDLWERLGGAGARSRTATTVFAWIAGLLALAALAWWLVQSLSRSAARYPHALAPPLCRQRSSRAWARDALAAHQAGDAREAARCVYHAAIARLAEEGAWRQDDSRTPREYLRLLAPGHRRRAVLADVTARFERAWYGTDVGSPDETRAMLARLQELGCLAPEHAI